MFSRMNVKIKTFNISNQRLLLNMQQDKSYLSFKSARRAIAFGHQYYKMSYLNPN